VGDKFGPKKVLFVTGLMFMITSIGCALANSIPSFIFYRIVGGLGVGGVAPKTHLNHPVFKHQSGTDGYFADKAIMTY
jgi:MFS family permease